MRTAVGNEAELAILKLKAAVCNNWSHALYNGLETTISAGRHYSSCRCPLGYRTFV